MKRLLLLGAGHAHLLALAAFAREPLVATQATLVSPHASLVYSGMLPGVVAGHYRAEQARIAIAPLAEAAGAAFERGTAVRIDAAAREVHLADGRVAAYDLLSIDTGAAMVRDRIPGAREHALFVRPAEAFVDLAERVVDLASRRVLDLVVIGGGAAGFELALGWQHRLAGGGDERARVALITGGEAPLAAYPPRVQRLAAAALARGRVTVFRESCARIESGAVWLGSGARLACDVPIVATGADAPAWIAGSGLALDARGFVATGPTLQSLSHPEVFAAGDIASRPDSPHPRSGVHAVRAGPPLAHNLRAFAAGGTLEPYRPPGRTLNLLSCGTRRAIASWGPWAAEGRWVWRWKDTIDRRFAVRGPAAGRAASG